MRTARITWPGAFHHVMSRGLEGRKILKDIELKKKFLEILRANSERLRIKIFAYCLMGNHYHLVLENSSGRMSDMLGRTNGRFGNEFRLRKPGKGYIFGDRFKSTLIENDSYLITSIMYTLFNPVRAGIVRHYSRADWTSIGEMLHDPPNPLIDRDFVLDLFGDLEGFVQQMNEYGVDGRLQVGRTRFGEVLGSEGYEKEIKNRLNRERNVDEKKQRRRADHFFVPLGQVYQAFERRWGIKVDEIDTGTHEGKRLRGELLASIRMNCGLRYSEIIELPLFSDVSQGTLGSMYWHAKKRERRNRKS